MTRNQPIRKKERKIREMVARREYVVSQAPANEGGYFSSILPPKAALSSPNSSAMHR
jgi:hypothetical protein